VLAEAGSGPAPYRPMHRPMRDAPAIASLRRDLHDDGEATSTRTGWSDTIAGTPTGALAWESRATRKAAHVPCRLSQTLTYKQTNPKRISPGFSRSLSALRADRTILMAELSVSVDESVYTIARARQIECSIARADMASSKTARAKPPQWPNRGRGCRIRPSPADGEPWMEDGCAGCGVTARGPLWLVWHASPHWFARLLSA